MRAYVQFSGILFTLVALGHLVRVVARWPLLIAVTRCQCWRR
jgi:hypothetical protein